MFPRRRNVQPPFEVMRTSASPAPPRVFGAAPGKPASQTAPAGWSMAPRQVITLRIPQGYVVLMAVGVLAMVVIAFGAGWSQGKSAQLLEQQRQLARDQQIATAAQRPAPPPDPGTAAPDPATQLRPAGQDTRQSGFNYFILTDASREYADRLVDFLRKSGVDAAAVPSHNTRLPFQVVALKPFRKEDLGKDEWTAYRQNLLKLGRIWKGPPYHGNNDLATLYNGLYKGPDRD